MYVFGTSALLKLDATQIIKCVNSKNMVQFYLGSQHIFARGGGQVVIMLVLNSEDTISNPAEVHDYSVKIVVEESETKQN